jgi:hypothetical protein
VLRNAEAVDYHRSDKGRWVGKGDINGFKGREDMAPSMAIGMP